MLSGHIRWCRPEFKGLIVGPYHCHSLLARRSVHGEAEDYDAKDSIAAGSEGLYHSTIDNGIQGLPVLCRIC
jgi:hypothetical protein